MKVKMVLFDLDGTLLPMDQNKFMHAYFGGLSKKLVPYGYEPARLIDAIWRGSEAMVLNDGEKTNERVFWDEFIKIYGKEALEHYPVFEDFYINDFDKARTSCGFDPAAAPMVRELKRRGFRVALATNPLFPQEATKRRMQWAGLSEDDFELYTTYENSSFCKPNLKYYTEVIKKLGVSAEECLMVGNDVGEDMVAEKLGMKVFLVTHCLINKSETDISVFPNGDLSALLGFVGDPE